MTIAQLPTLHATATGASETIAKMISSFLRSFTACTPADQGDGIEALSNRFGSEAPGPRSDRFPDRQDRIGVTKR